VHKTDYRFRLQEKLFPKNRRESIGPMIGPLSNNNYRSASWLFDVSLYVVLLSDRSVLISWAFFDLQFVT